MNIVNTISTFNLTAVLSHQGRGLPLAMTPSPDLLCPYLVSDLLELTSIQVLTETLTETV